MENQEVGHVYIPGHIMARDDINLQCKVIFGKIVALTGKKGYCYASNAWLAKEIGLSADTVSTYVSKLVKLELLRIEVEKTEGEGTKRRLFVFMPGTPYGLGESAVRGLGETAVSVSNSIDPIDESVKNFKTNEEKRTILRKKGWTEDAIEMQIEFEDKLRLEGKV